jgi:hypothetical protein
MNHELTKYLPDFPRTRHLPFNPNAKRDDLIASEAECAIIFESENVYVEEKVDGANSGFTIHENEPVIRNRNHILRKGYSGGKTAGKMQFAPAWNYFYEHKQRFEDLFEILGEQVGVYGEWLYLVHGIRYNRLPEYFMVFDLWHPEEFWIDTGRVREACEFAGFQITPLLHKGPVPSFEFLADLCQQDSPFCDGRREGVYIKVTDGTRVTHRFKMVRHDFIQGEFWQKNVMEKNKLVR